MKTELRKDTFVLIKHLKIERNQNYVYIYIYINFWSYPTLNSFYPLQISMLYIETIDVWTKNHATQIRAACGQNV
jgi:hypothetical protein